MYSNGYIFRFAIIMVVIVAAVLSGVSMVLKPYQERNATNEKMQTILAAAEVEASTEEVQGLYDKYIDKELVLNLDGEIIGQYEGGEMVVGDVRAFDVVLKEQLKNLKDMEAGNESAEVLLPVYIFNDNSKVIYIIPMQGLGLWGPVYGTIALKDDMRTIFGAVFSHKGETPGLGAEIATPMFQDQFKDKTIFEGNEFVSITVVKGGVENSKIDPMHGVDAISGGTITSDGVSDMLKNTFELYVPYFEKQQ